MFPYCFRVSQRVVLVGLLVSLLSAGDALAQRGGGRGGGGGGGQIRSFSGGGGGGSSFSRGGGGGGGSSRSFSRSGGSGMSRSYSGGSGMSRSFSSGSGQSRSFSRESSSRGSSSISRSFGRESSGMSRSFGSADSSRGLSGQSYRRSGGDSGGARPTTREFSGQSSRQNFGGRGDVSRSIDRGSQQRLSDSQGMSRRFEGAGSRSGPPTSQRAYTSGRPNFQEVSNFLAMRGDGRSGRIGDATGRGGVNFSDRGLGGDRGRGDFTTGSSRQDFRSRVDQSRSQGDRAWSDRFGGNGDRRVGDATRPGSGRDIAGRDFNGKRDFGDRKFVDGKYQSWRRGGDGRINDQRDWSGRWKDGDRFGAADRIRGHWRGDWDRDDFPFHGGWKGGHWHGDHDHWNHWGYWDHWHGNRPWHWWGWATAPLLTSWLSYGWDTPYYWDYGPGEYINCYDDVVYVNGLWYQPAPVYYGTATAIAERAPDWTAEQAQQVEWLPLGVFALARDGVPDNNMLVQLAVTKEGVIGGTATNKATGASFPVEGTVDKQSQRAVWKYTDEKNQPVMMETSVYNLTQPEATGLVHYGPDNIQVVEFVRLETPVAAEALPAPTK